MEQIQATVDTLAHRLSRAVVVDDQNLQLVAVSEDFGDADPARIWSLLHRRTRPEDVDYESIKELPGPGYVPEKSQLQLWRRLCVPIRCRGLLLGFVWIIDRHADLTEGQVADAARAAESIGLLLHRRLAKANAAHVALARSHGVTFTEDSPVRRVVSHDDHVEMHTDREVFHGSSLTVCAGSWTSSRSGASTFRKRLSTASLSTMGLR